MSLELIALPCSSMVTHLMAGLYCYCQVVYIRHRQLGDRQQCLSGALLTRECTRARCSWQMREAQKVP